LNSVCHSATERLLCEGIGALFFIKTGCWVERDNDFPDAGLALRVEGMSTPYIIKGNDLIALEQKFITRTLMNKIVTDLQAWAAVPSLVFSTLPRRDMRKIENKGDKPPTVYIKANALVGNLYV